MKHGIYVSGQRGVSTPVTATSGIPFAIGVSPIHAARKPAAVGIPVMCGSMAEFTEKFGYSDDWEKYPLCEFAYALFTLYGVSSVVFCCMLDANNQKAMVAAADLTVSAKQVTLPFEAVASTIVVKAAGGTGSAHKLDTDYTLHYDERGSALVLTVMEDGACADAVQLNISYDKAMPENVTATTVAAGLENIELCMASANYIPDIICAPGYSSDNAVAAAMEMKAAGINGMFRAMTLLDLDAQTAEAAIAAKEAVADKNAVVCWPMCKKGGKVYHLSTHIAGILARTDAESEGCPYESPSNKEISCDEFILPSGETCLQSVSDANKLNANGIVTGIHFCGRLVAWGNYTAAYPEETATEEAFISNSRVAAYIGNTLIRTFWEKLDAPVTRRFVDSVVDQTNIWLNGLVGAGYLYGASVEATAEDNPTEDLQQGIVRARIRYASPTPAQDIEFTIEYDASYATSALST